MQRMPTQEFLGLIFDFKDVNDCEDSTYLTYTKKLITDIISKLFEMLDLC